MEIKLTAKQISLLTPLFLQVNASNLDGYASIIAQVYPDGMILKLLTYKQTKEIQKTLDCKNCEHKGATLAERNLPLILPDITKSVAKRIAVQSAWHPPLPKDSSSDTIIIEG